MNNMHLSSQMHLCANMLISQPEQTLFTGLHTLMHGVHTEQLAVELCIAHYI